MNISNRKTFITRINRDINFNHFQRNFPRINIECITTNKNNKTKNNIIRKEVNYVGNNTGNLKSNNL